MLLTTSLEDITQLEKKLLTFVWTELENSLITVPDFKDSWFSIQLEEELVLVWALYYWKDCQLITERNPNSDSQFTLHLKSQLQSLNLITPFYLLTLFWNILMLQLCWITKPFTTFAEEIWTLKDPLTLI